MRKFLEKRLAAQARRLLRRAHPEIVAITGSVGKSSAKQAVAAVLARLGSVLVSPKNFNTEIGVPLTILRLPAGGRSPWRWLGILWRGCARSWGDVREYPSMLVLEMGADKPGDIAYLINLAPPKISVVTTVGESHVEKFGSIENVAKEKRTLVEKLPKDGCAVLNRDDERVWAMRERTKARVMSFGFHESADVRALEVSMNYALDGAGTCGMRFKITAGGSTIPVFLPNILGRHAIYAALAAAAVGLAKGMNLVAIADGLAAYEPPPGRTRVIPGIKRTVLIDDTYNASPKSTKAALEILKELPADESRRKFAVLGDMLELGVLTVGGHEEIGRKAVECGADCLVFVGEKMGDAEKAALAAGASPDKLFHFSTPGEAGRFVQERMKQGDIVLIKGSRGMHMEIVVKELMADPLAADSLLVSHVE